MFIYFTAPYGTLAQYYIFEQPKTQTVMKKIFAAIAVMLSINAFAQDVIIKKNGEELKAKVIEITETTIKYKEQDNLDGPVYNINKSEVFKLKYANGKSDFFGNSEVKKEEPVKKIEQPAPVAQANKYDSLMKLSKSNKGWGIFGITAGVVFVASGTTILVLAPNAITSEAKGLYYVMGGVLLAGGVAELALGGVCISKSKKQFAAAQQYKGTAYIKIPYPVAYAGGGFGIGTRITF